MIRVLHVLHSMNRGGAETMLMNYYRNIDRTLVQFDFLLTEQNQCQYEDEILKMGGKVYRVPLLKLSNPFPYKNGVTRFFQEHPEYNIVHSHTSSKSALPLWIAKQCGVKVCIAHSHNNSSGKWSVDRGVRDTLKIPLKHVATHRFACSKEAAIWLYGSTDGCYIMPNAIDLSAFSVNKIVRERIRKNIGAKDDVVVLGMVARFSHQKNHLFALDVFAKYHTINPNSQLLLVGDGELRKQIESKITTLGISECVVMTSVVSNVSDYIQAMDAVLMPSFNEGLPVSMIEAQASGVKCILSTGVPEEVDVTGNISFLPLERDAWVDKIMEIEPGWRDPEVEEKLEQAGYEIKTAAKELQDWYVQRYQEVIE